MKFILFDRITTANDNAEYFYKWLEKNHPEIELRYILDSNSFDWPGLVNDGFKLIDFNDTAKVQAELDTADFICSSYLIRQTIKHFKFTAKFIFLNHGCFFRMTAYLAGAPFDLMLAGNQLEYKILINHYGFPASRIALTGLPRQDSLIINNKNYTGPRNNILIQFWWRPWLVNDRQAFEKSEFYSNAIKFLKDDRLEKLSKKYNINFLFKLHRCMERYEDLFKDLSYVNVVSNEEIFEPLFIKSNLLITDFTSNTFEMGMIEKPCLYYMPDKQTFDQELFRLDHSISNLESMGIGPVTADLDDLFNKLEELIKNNYQLDDIYLKRRKEQLSFIQDPRCCERAFEAIMKLK